MKTNSELLACLDQIKARVSAERHTMEDWERIAFDLQRAAKYAAKCRRFQARLRADRGIRGLR